MHDNNFYFKCKYEHINPLIYERLPQFLLANSLDDCPYSNIKFGMEIIFHFDVKMPLKLQLDDKEMSLWRTKYHKLKEGTCDYFEQVASEYIENNYEELMNRISRIKIPYNGEFKVPYTIKSIKILKD